MKKGSELFLVADERRGAKNSSDPFSFHADAKHAQLTARVEDGLIHQRRCFQVIYDHHLEDLRRYRTLILAGCVALSDQQIAMIRDYVNNGGQVCVVGPAATHDEWLRPRAGAALDDLPAPRVVHIGDSGDLPDAIGEDCDERSRLSIQAEPGLCVELTEQAGRRLVHLVNYRAEKPMENVAVRLRIPAGKQVTKVSLASPERSGQEADLEIPFHQEADLVSFTVPKVEVYQIAVVATK